MEDFGSDITGLRLEMHLIRLRRADLPRECRDASRPIAAKLGLRTVRIEEPHAEISTVRSLHEDDSLAADSRPARANRRQHPPVAGERSVPVINQDEVVSGSMHLDEADAHQYHQPFTSGTSSSPFMRRRSISTL